MKKALSIELRLASLQFSNEEKNMAVSGEALLRGGGATVFPMQQICQKISEILLLCSNF